MIQYISAILCLSAINAQYAPQWGSISCDSSLTDFFPPDGRLSYMGYNRYYTFTASYATSINRDVRIQTCIEKTPIVVGFADNIDGARVENNAWIRSATYPDNAIPDVGDPQGISCDSETEVGYSYYFQDVPEGDWEIGVYNNEDTSGGKYKLSVECIEPPKPAAGDLKNTNVTQTFAYKDKHSEQGGRKISCGVSAYDTIVAGDDTDWWEFTITDYAQEIAFTTATPETAFSSPKLQPDGTDSVNKLIDFYWWDFGSRLGGNGWQHISASIGNSGTGTIGDAYSLSDDNILMLSPGYYYIGVGRGNGGNMNANVNYVLSMLCWNNDAIANTIAGTDYKAATFSPTPSPVTWSPTTPTITSPTTPYPTIYPTVTFDGFYDKVLKTMDMGTISCGIHKHKNLVKKTSDYYMFQLLETTQVYFDTCMNDMTRFPARLRLYRYDSPLDSDFFYVSNSETTSYCNVIDMNLGYGFYYVEISGQTKKTDYGEYVLRMGCEIGQEDHVTVVSSTDEPTPSPTGVAHIAAKDGRVVGDIMCGVTVEGETSSQKGDFHRFTIIRGGIDWVKFDTCDATSFENYLFVYDYWNQTAHEHWNYQSYNSIGFHYEDDTTCNQIIMNDLVPGVYYVNIDGYNYYYDHGEYTIKMTCSDNNAVKSTGNFNEYSPGLEWWAILLIVLGCLICCGCVVFLVCYMKKKKDGGSSSTGGSEMANRTDDAGE